MSWLATWCAFGRPHYAAHDTEDQAEQDAKNKRASGYPATHFEVA